jgi:hypothetical protein
MANFWTSSATTRFRRILVHGVTMASYTARPTLRLVRKADIFNFMRRLARLLSLMEPRHVQKECKFRIQCALQCHYKR